MQLLAAGQGAVQQAAHACAFMHTGRASGGRASGGRASGRRARRASGEACPDTAAADVADLAIMQVSRASMCLQMSAFQHLPRDSFYAFIAGRGWAQ